MDRDQAIINCEVYKGKTNYLGIAKITMPKLAFLTQTMSGVGIAGNVEAVLIGQMDTMGMTIEFRNFTEEALSLAGPEISTLELFVATQYEDPAKRSIAVKSIKHIVDVIPKSLDGGSVAPASTGDPSGEYAVRYWATYIDGQRTMELDPFNSICFINGVDYLEPVRKALGK